MTAPGGGPPFVQPTKTYYPRASYLPDVNETAVPMLAPASGLFLYSVGGALTARNATGEASVPQLGPASGQQSGAVATSNTLSVFEEGTFVPSLVFSGGGGNVTYSAQVGRYQVIGRYVHFNARIAIATIDGTQVGLTSVTLPFAAGAGLNNPLVANLNNLLNTAIGAPGAQVNASTAAAIIILYAGGTNSTALITAALTAGAVIGISGCYPMF